MDPARRRSVVDVALQEGGVVSVGAVTRAKVLDRLRLGDAAFRQMTRAAAVGVLLLLSGVMISLVAGSLPALRTFGLELPDDRAMESGHGEIRRAGADLRHARHVVHRHADCGPGGPDDCLLPHRAVPAMAAAADRHRHRAVGRRPEHHLRDLGAFRLCPVPAGDAAAVFDQNARLRRRLSRRCSPDRPTASAC